MSEAPPSLRSASTPPAPAGGRPTGGALETLGGVAPPAPAWFADALASAPERFTAQEADATIEVLAWGERGRPGVLLAHGLCAHADWWSFIAPLLLPDYRVAALSFTGMGGSSARARYRLLDYAQEMHACAQAAGLFDDGRPPVYVGHSHGGMAALYASLAFRGRMSGTVLIDVGLGGFRRENDPLPGARRAVQPAGRVFPTLEDALAAFRLWPSQECANLYILDFVARRSLRPVDGGGWTWRFDPALLAKLDMRDLYLVAGAPCGPLVNVIGADSKVLERTGGAPHPMLQRRGPTLSIPHAGHHVMLDEPLALVAALREAIAEVSTGAAVRAR